MIKKYKIKKLRRINNNGFTIMETMIAVSIFLVVVVVGMGSLLNVTLLHRKSQDMRSIMDNLSFTMEDISRSLRTGYNYHCIDNGDLLATDPYSCSSGDGISFKTASGNQWVYIISDGSIQKSTAGGAVGTFIMLTLPEVQIDPTSSFSVVGAEPPSDTLQPFATIKLIGTITSENNVVSPFSLRTSVSQRLVDI